MPLLRNSKQGRHPFDRYGGLQTYNQIYNTTVSPRVGGDNAYNYTSPLLHSVVVANLAPGATYFYRVGDGTTFSGVFNFTALKAPGGRNLCLA